MERPSIGEPVSLSGSLLNMVRQGTKIDEIMEGYPALDREKVELACLYVQAFPRRGRPVSRPWAKKGPVRVTRERCNFAGDLNLTRDEHG